MSTTRQQAAALRAQGKTQDEVAAQLGVSVRTVRRWETGQPDTTGHPEPANRTKADINRPTGQPAKCPPDTDQPANRTPDTGQEDAVTLIALLASKIQALEARVSALEAERAVSVTLQPQTHGTGFRPHWIRDKDAQEFPGE